MAEIKSAVEIAMERTQGLRLSAAEKEKIKEEELHSRAHALVNRFLEVDFHFREVEKELAKYAPEQRGLLEEFMLRDFAEALSLERDNELAFQGIQTLAPDRAGPIPRIRELAREYRQKSEEATGKAAEALRAKWANLGISGPALVPKVAGSPEYAEALKAFRPACEERLKALKREIGGAA
jgi:hypothetical protein